MKLSGHRLTTTLAAAILGVGLLASEPTALAGVPVSDQNAALRYWRTFELGDSDSSRVIAEYTPDPQAEQWIPTDELVKALAQQQERIEALIEATRFEHCDFGVDYDDGPYVLLPHLNKLRSSALLLLLDGRMHAHQGDINNAVERSAAVYRMAEHLSHERTLISSLVSLAIFAVADDFVAELDSAGKLNAEHRATIANALGRFGTGDPFGMKAAVAAERDVMANWMRRVLVDDGLEGGIDIALALFDFEAHEMDQAREDVARRIPDEATAERMIATFEQYYTMTLQAWDDPDAVAKFERLEKTYLSNPDGLLVGHFAMHSSIHRNYRRGQVLFHTALTRVGLNAPEPTVWLHQEQEPARRR